MNLAPPLIFGGAQQGNNLLSPGQSGANPILPAPKAGSDTISPATPTNAPSLSMLQQQQQAGSSQLQSQVKHKGKDKWNIDANDDVSLFQACGSQKRARTRITDDQLKILRSHFDINNSPSEESILEMSKKANLPQKVRQYFEIIFVNLDLSFWLILKKLSRKNFTEFYYLEFLKAHYKEIAESLDNVQQIVFRATNFYSYWLIYFNLFIRLGR